MSAYVVAQAHIDYLVLAAVELTRPHRGYGIRYGGDRVTDDTADEIGAALLAANIASVNERYPTARELPGSLPAPATYRFDPTGLPRLDPVQLLKALDCYEFQSCEPANWRNSEARQFCERLRMAAICELPGYDEATWEITRATVTTP